MQSAEELKNDELSDVLEVADYITLTKAVKDLTFAGENMKRAEGGEKYAVLVDSVGGVIAFSVQNIAGRRDDLVEGFNHLGPQ